MDRHQSSSPGTPAQYGHACTNCAQSKCKCIIRRTGGSCERCRRLKKDCRPAETVRRRHQRKPAVSRTARLEEKLDGLVSLIKAGSQSNGVTTSPSATAAIDDSMSYSATHIVPVLTPASDDSTGSSNYLLPTNACDTRGEPSPVEAEEYLINFQTYKSKYFPFVYISSTTSAQQLRQERPFLWLCIMAVCSKSTSQQQALGNKIRQTIAQEIVVQSEGNIDLLLGLLTFIGWPHYQFRSKPFLAVFTQLAVSMVFELGLNKSVPKDTQLVPCVSKYSKPLTPRTMEERRAVLGCFLISSIISSFIQKIDALRWTPHMEECLQIVDERKECPNDEILVQQVRLQLLVEKMAQGTARDEAMDSPAQRGPPSLYSGTLHSKLQDIKTNLLTQPQTDKVLLLHLYSAELETALSPTFLHTNQLTCQQRNSLDRVLQSINSWFDIFFTITPAAYIDFPFSIFSQLIRCLITIYRLTTLDDPSWDKNGVWKTVDPLLIIHRVINNLEQVAILAGLDNSDSHERDAFSRAAQMFGALRPGWETKLAQGDLLATPLQQSSDETFPLGAFGVESFDDDWFMDLLLSPNY